MPTEGRKEEDLPADALEEEEEAAGAPRTDLRTGGAELARDLLPPDFTCERERGAGLGNRGNRGFVIRTGQTARGEPGRDTHTGAVGVVVVLACKEREEGASDGGTAERNGTADRGRCASDAIGRSRPKSRKRRF